MTEYDNGRMLLVHAHPDDETIGSGVLMAKYVAGGAQVTLVTCTLGEEGEVLVKELEHLAAANEDRLGPQRLIEWQNAMGELGVTDFRLLGAEGKYRDSGMVGVDSNNREGNFMKADLLEAALDLVPIIRELKPHVLVTYDDFGGYGHPDHVKAHQTAMYGAQLAAARTFRADLGEPWDIPKIYWTAVPKSRMKLGLEALRAIDPEHPMAKIDVDEMPFGVSDDLITTEIDGPDFKKHKIAAMTAYPTQINMTEGWFAMAHQDGVMDIEYFRLVKGDPGPDVNEFGWETDVFSGLKL